MNITEFVYDICNAIGGISEEDMEKIREVVISHTTNREVVDYCGFTNVEDIIKDYKLLKKYIKKWELECDELHKIFSDHYLYVTDRIEAMSHEIMSVNM